MHLLTSRFINVALALTIVFALAQAFYYFRFRRKLSVTDVDKNLWQLRLFSLFLVALLFFAMLYLPSTGFYRDIDPSPDARETAFQNLLANQRRIGAELDQMREVLYVVFMMSMMYLVAIGTFIGRIWRDRQKRGSANDPAVKKPLGLEL
jgi:hypothetical protein